MKATIKCRESNVVTKLELVNTGREYLPHQWFDGDGAAIEVGGASEADAKKALIKTHSNGWVVIFKR